MSELTIKDVKTTLEEYNDVYWNPTYHQISKLIDMTARQNPI